MAEEPPNSTSLEDVPREIRSALLKYNDSILHEAEDHVYSSLATNKTRIRLLRLYAGVIEDPTVTCQIFEAEFLPEIASPFIVDSDGSLTNVAIEYEALSWRWSGETQSPYSIILVGTDGKTKNKRVSKTLGLSMKYLRREKDRILWIDAICINQSDMEERSSQVSIMSLIYTHAQRVCIWLGEDDQNSRKAVAFIREVNQAATHGDVEFGDDPIYIPMWRAFLAFMQREWFTRRWVVQEIVMAAKANVHCGSDELEWKSLAVAVVVFEHLVYVPHSDENGLVTNWFDSMSQLSASILLEISSKVFREITIHGYEEIQLEGTGLRSLEHLVTGLTDFECGEPYDYVYALIAMAKDAFPTPPTFSTDNSHAAIVRRVCGTISERAAYPVDYKCTYLDFCKDFVEFCVQMCAKRDPGQALDVLCRPWAKNWQLQDAGLEVDPRFPKERGTLLRDDLTLEDMLVAQVEPEKDEKTAIKSTQFQDRFNQTSRAHLFENKRRSQSVVARFGLPSWVATVERAPFRNASHVGILGVDATQMDRNNGDLLVGSPGNEQSMYNADQSRSLDFNSLRFKNRGLLGHCSLYVKGFCFDRVAKVTQASRAGAVPLSWFDLGNWPEATATVQYKHLPEPPAAFWRTLVADRDDNNCKAPHSYKRECRIMAFKGEIKDGAIDITDLTHRDYSTNAEYCRRVQSVIWNRVLIKTENGTLGLVSKDVRAGDLVCVLYGCTVPVILRQGNAKFKTRNEHESEFLEDGIEAMKRLVSRVERYREQKLRYFKRSEQERAEIKKDTDNYNKGHVIIKDAEKIQRLKQEDEELEEERKSWWGKDDTQSDIDSEDDVPDIEKNEAQQDLPEETRQLTEDQKLKREQEEAPKKQWEKDDKETLNRHQERQRKARIRDPLRHYKFLDQAYIHGMMEGEAVNQKLRTGKPDHVFEIR